MTILQPDAKVVAYGSFTSVNGQNVTSLARLENDGSLEAAFIPGGSVGYCCAVQTDGRIIAADNGHIRRLKTDGTADSSFSSSVNNIVNCVAVQPDGRILVGGGFTSLAGHACNYLGRLNTNGTFDSNFTPSITGSGFPRVYCLALQADGKIVVAGVFNYLAGQACNCFGRLNSNGTFDSSFTSGTDGALVVCAALQPDGKIVAGGLFTKLDGQTVLRLGRVNADGTLDTGFNASVTGGSAAVYSLAIQADGKILVGGTFTSLSGQVCSHLGRVNPDGSPDNSFNAGITRSANPSVRSLAVDATGRVLVGGLFDTLGGVGRTNLGRLNNTIPASQNLSFNGSTLTWQRGGASPEVSRVSFGFSTNGSDWVPLGDGTNISGKWQLGSISIPPSALIRARGFVTAGYQNGSSWFVESWSPRGAPVIQVNDSAFGLRSGQFGFHITGSSGDSLVTEFSTNLCDWTGLATNTVGTGLLYFSDPARQNFTHGFYRLRSTP